MGNKIKELPIWSHSIGAGLFLGYQDPLLSIERNALISRVAAMGRNPTFEEVRTTEVGALFTDDLLASPYTATKGSVAPTFAKGASIKLLGCNVAVSDWDSVWQGTDAYHKKFHKYPPGSLPHRLHPGKGTYGAYDPTPTP